MKIKCDYCGAYINDTDERCSNCGAVNSHLQRNANEAPKTIEELKQWYVDHNLPDENITRFFIGKNYTEKRAFGIYKDEQTGNVVVYKNKDDGTRAIRYEGKDEAYGVNELYIRLKEEIINQKQHNLNKQQGRKRGIFNKGDLLTIIIVSVIFLIIFLTSIFSVLAPKRGYYLYDDDYYYYQNGSWYEYDDYSGWGRAYSVPKDLKDNDSDYYESNYYYSTYGIDDFRDSSYYEETSSSSSSSSSWNSSSS